MPSKVTRHKANPYKLMMLLWYGHYDWANWRPGRKVYIRTGPCARLMRVSSSRLREYLEWLADHRFISELETDHGKARFIMRPLPHGRSGEGDTDEQGEVESSMPAWGQGWHGFRRGRSED